MQNCWHCHHQIESDKFFCDNCGSVQPMTSIDHFERFGVERSLNIESSHIDKSYFRLQQQFHPDKFAKKAEKERLISLDHSAKINEAYRVLKDRFKRAVYLLELEGFKLENAKPSPDILAYIMEVSENIEDAKTNAEIEKIQVDLEEMIEAELNNFNIEYLSKYLANAANSLIKIKYLSKLIEDTKLKQRILK